LVSRKSNSLDTDCALLVGFYQGFYKLKGKKGKKGKKVKKGKRVKG